MALKLAEFKDGCAIIESNLDGSLAIEELQSPEAKTLAIREATKRGIAGAAIGISGGTYPVDADGVPLEPTKEGKWPQVEVGGFRIDIPVAATFR
jgi:hypothetical protein